ncbi:Matrix metallopeptidase 19 [Mactra antiquata]
MWKIVLSFTFYIHICMCVDIWDTFTDEEGLQPSQKEIDNYLEKYGYLPSSNHISTTSGNMEDTRKHAIRLFQKFTRLLPSGEIDENTIAKMRQPRCGYPDVTINEPVDLSEPMELNHNQFMWTNKTITWKIRTYSNKLTKSEQRTAIKNGLRYWEEASDIHFVEGKDEANIVIEFVSGDHGDNKPFDGPGKVIGHAFAPTDGRVHFDEEEHWVFHQNNGVEIEMAAAHELGHALGLGHIIVPDALMNPFSLPYKKNFKLHYADISAIQNIYGPPVPPVDVALGPEISATEIQQRMLTTLCNKPIDAVTSGPDNMLHVFLGPYVYKINLECYGDISDCIEEGFPKPIREVFELGPKRVKAAAFLPDHRQRTYLFKGRKVWRYKGYKLDEGYPKKLNNKNLPYKPSAAFVQKNQYADYQLYLFGGKHFWQLSIDTEEIASTTMRTDVYWDYVPTKPNAFVQTRDGSIYVFKKNRYNKFDHRRVIWEKRKLIVEDLLGVDCSIL